jgi:hypothetical protein
MKMAHASQVQAQDPKLLLLSQPNVHIMEPTNTVQTASERKPSEHLQNTVITVIVVGIACLLLLGYYLQVTNPLPYGVGVMLPTERLALTPWANSTTVLTLRIVDDGTSSTTVVGVTLNGIGAQGFGYVSYGGDFIGVKGGESLKAGKSGTIDLTFSAVPVSSTTYNIIVTTAAGNSYPMTFTWP